MAKMEAIRISAPLDSPAASALLRFRRFALRPPLILKIVAHAQAKSHSRGGSMAKSRREFLADASAGLFGAAAVLHAQDQKSATPKSETSSPRQQAVNPPPGTPSAFGTAPAVGPEVSPATFAEAEKLVRVEMTVAERAQAAGNWRNSMAALYERRPGPKKVALEPTLSPASRWNPVLPGMNAGPEHNQFIRGRND